MADGTRYGVGSTPGVVWGKQCHSCSCNQLAVEPCFELCALKLRTAQRMRYAGRNRHVVRGLGQDACRLEALFTNPCFLAFIQIPLLLHRYALLPLLLQVLTG